MNWTVLLAMKALPGAKSRLRPAVASATDHADLVEAMRADTIAAVEAAGRVAHIVTIADAPGTSQLLVQSAPGLNTALREAAAYARAHWPRDGIAALVADLPALLPTDLDAALDAAALAPRGFVADTATTGTTMLTARPGVDLDPAFGVGSAARHAVDAVAIAAAPGLRQDVDTWADLEACVPLGLGIRTAAAYRQFTSGRHDVEYDRRAR
jgi:2-phospho-L-lactate guanylyltransferase